MIRLILTDVDGTLIGEGSRIHPRVFTALETARAAGMHLGICTGRPVYSLARDYARVVSESGVHIFQNGAHAGKLGGTVVHQSLLPRAAFLKLVVFSRQSGIALEVYTASGCFAEVQSEISLEHQRLINLEVTETDVLTLSEPIIRVQWVVTPTEYPIVEAAMQGIAGISYSSAGTPDLPNHIYTSVTRIGTNKLEAAAAVANYYGISLNEVMMVGDGENDLEILAGVGYGVAMGNATTRVQETARAVVGHVNDGGLAEAITLALETRA
jgi:Cof subfamily protein (haloacid dehalogenase superfamily)